MNLTITEEHDFIDTVAVQRLLDGDRTVPLRHCDVLYAVRVMAAAGLGHSAMSRTLNCSGDQIIKLAQEATNA